MDPEPRKCRGGGTTDAGSHEGTKPMFEHSLIDLETKPRPRRRWLSLSIAVGLHVLGLTTFAFASYWNIGEVPPRTVDVFFTEPPLPEMSDEGRRQKLPERPPVTEEEQSPRTPTRLEQPTNESVPEKIPTNPPSTPAAEVLSMTRTGGDNDDSADGKRPCPGCPVAPGFDDRPVSPPIEPNDGDPVEPIHIKVGMTRPEIVHQVQPRYTEIARQAGIQGTVVVEAVIDEKGQVTGARVLRGLPMGLDEAAVEAIQQWQFKPATLAGRPVKVFYALTVNFRLQR